jgi:hypothetical protein
VTSVDAGLSMSLSHNDLRTIILFTTVVSVHRIDVRRVQAVWVGTPARQPPLTSFPGLP